MRHDDVCVITRTATIKDPKTHIAKTQTINLDPFNCRLGKASGNLTQATPQGVLIQLLRLYIPNALSDIKSGDIATIIVKNKDGSTRTTKYTVGNIYYPNSHHIEADVAYKEEV